MVRSGVFGEGWAGVPPGPGLGAALAGRELASVPNDQIIDVLQAQARQLAHEQARMLATLVEVSRATPGALGPLRADEAYEWASGEISAALSWTGRTADRELAFAETVVVRLPLVFDALWAGRIDRARAWVFADHLDPTTCTLDIDQTEAICAHLVPLAAGLTTGELAARLLRAIIAVDPDHAHRRYTRALREREVISYLDRDGTVTITAQRLDSEEAATALQRLRALARAVKRAGHPARLAHIQADLFCRLLNGAYQGLTQAEIITDLLGRASSGLGDETEEHRHADEHSEDGDSANVRPRPVGTRSPEPTEPTEPTEPAEPTGSSGEPEPPPSERARCGVEIRIGLGTLLGLDDQPGEIPSLGPVLASVARRLVAAQTQGAQWRFAVTDPDGYLILAGAIRRRPAAPGAGSGGSIGGSMGGIVEIHVPAELLDQLRGTSSVCSPWAGVIGEIADQYRDRDRLLAALDNDRSERFARAALARHIEVRDRTCSFMGCRCPAHECDLDHTVDYAHGGPTTRSNLGPGCGRHHPDKHGRGWRLRQPRPGHFIWTSPLGRVYRTRGQPIAPPHIDRTPSADDYPRPPPADTRDGRPPLS